MAWLWDSWEEFEEAVQPVGIQRGFFRLAQADTLFESDRRLATSVEQLAGALRRLGSLGFGADWTPQLNVEPVLREAHNALIDGVIGGEQSLLLHKRLAKSEDSYGFLHQHDLLDHWDHYAQSKRIGRELQKFVEDSGQLLEGYYRLQRVDEQFLLENLELPEALEADFRAARNLFSVGYDEIGLLVAGRGLEAVLRSVARARHLQFDDRRRTFPASEADFADLIEIISQVRWKVSGVPLISRETRALLHFLRTIRNSHAHPTAHKQNLGTARETARVAVETANAIWKSVATRRARLDPLKIQKTW